MIAKQAIAKELVDYLKAAPEADACLDIDTDLLESGRLDSLQVMDLVCFLESRFQVQMQPADINPDNLRSVSRIAKYVHTQMA